MNGSRLGATGFPSPSFLLSCFPSFVSLVVYRYARHCQMHYSSQAPRRVVTPDREEDLIPVEKSLVVVDDDDTAIVCDQTANRLKSLTSSVAMKRRRISAVNCSSWRSWLPSPAASSFSGVLMRTHRSVSYAGMRTRSCWTCSSDEAGLGFGTTDVPFGAAGAACCWFCPAGGPRRTGS